MVKTLIPFEYYLCDLHFLLHFVFFLRFFVFSVCLFVYPTGIMCLWHTRCCVDSRRDTSGMGSLTLPGRCRYWSCLAPLPVWQTGLIDLGAWTRDKITLVALCLALCLQTCVRAAVCSFAKIFDVKNVLHGLAFMFVSPLVLYFEVVFNIYTLYSFVVFLCCIVLWYVSL